MNKWIAPAALAVFLLPAVLLIVPGASHAGGNLARARADTAQRAFGLAQTSLGAGKVQVDVACAWSLRWAQAEKAAGNAGALADHVTRLQALEAEVTKQYKAGMAGGLDVATVAYYRADAEALAAGQ
jgi:hypothetical protein